MNVLSLELSVEFEDPGEVHVLCDARVDGVPVADYLKHAVSLAALHESTKGSGGYFLITCSCGDPGCAGINSPVVVTHHETMVDWEVAEPRPPRRFSFSVAEYRSTIQEALKRFPSQAAALLVGKKKKIAATPLGEEALFLGGHLSSRGHR
ncbi:MAG: hypothetical protein K1Y01_08915 [Vicinamibacteria bacterium]|nr:hypothetical protein [Vicinamibacteria bacterium]